MALWVPRGSTNGGELWERVVLSGRPGFVAAPGVRAAPATGMRARRPRRGLLGRFLGRAEGQPWLLPNGETVLQVGTRRADLLVAWSEDRTSPADEAAVKALWPTAERVDRLGAALYLVVGVKPPEEVGSLSLSADQPAPSGLPPAAVAPPPSGCPRAEAENAVARARAAGEPRGLAAALADLGSLYLHESQAENAIQALGESLAMARQLGDRNLEVDVLGSLGLVTLASGHAGRAAEIFEMELTLARESGDRYAEKLSLERLGLARLKFGDPAQARASFEEAFALARSLGHRRQEADLLWHLSIAQAELGQRDAALANGRAAVGLMLEMGNPQADVFAEHLRKYAAGESAAPLSPVASAPWAALGIPAEAGLWDPAAEPGATPVAGPGLLRMALSVAKSMARFAGSGFKVAAVSVYEQRVGACAACEHHTGLRCRLCGCFTAAKARIAHEECPLGKWAR